MRGWLLSVLVAVGLALPGVAQMAQDPEKRLEELERALERELVVHESEHFLLVYELEKVKSKKKRKPEEVIKDIEAKRDTINFGRIGTATADNKDDLKKIKGIGPFIEQKLNALGIYTFQQISNFTPEDETSVTKAIEFFPGRIQRDNWAAQAKDWAK